MIRIFFKIEIFLFSNVVFIFTVKNGMLKNIL